MRVFLPLLLAALAVPSQAANFTIDPQHSGVSFRIRHMTNRVNGAFRDVTGALVFDVKKPAQSEVQATIQTASIDTRNEKRDNHLRSADFFDAAKFPIITFKSAKVVPSKIPNRFKVTGALSMHGVEQPVTLDVEYLGSQKDPQGKNRAGFTATGKVNRKDFGIVWNKALDAGGFLLGEDVDFTLDIEAVEVGQ